MEAEPERNAKRLDAFAKAVTSIKEACQRLEVPHGWLDDYAGLDPIRVFRQGNKPGGGRGTHFEFVLEYHGIRILLANRASFTRTQPNGRAEATGRACLLVGIFSVVWTVQQFVLAVGGFIEKEGLSRVDVCLDMAGVPVDAFQVPFGRRHFITRAVRESEYRVAGENTGFCIGSGPCILRVYDKLRELQLHRDEEKLVAMKQNRWGGRTPDSANRVEFQLRRAWLKEHGVGTVHDYARLRPALVRKLVHEWFRLTNGSVDRDNNHQCRAATHALWEDVQRAFEQWAGTSDEPLRPLAKGAVQPDALAKQAVGCLSSAALLARRFFTSTIEAKEYFLELIDGVLQVSPEWLGHYLRELTQQPGFQSECGNSGADLGRNAADQGRDDASNE